MTATSPTTPMPADPLRVLLADDEPVARAGIRSILTADSDIEVVAEADTGRQAIELAQAHRLHVAVLDIRMPGGDGLTATAELRRTTPEVGIVILTTFGHDEYVHRALAEGADAFVLKAGDPRELSLAIHAAADGAAYLSPRVARRLITAHRERAHSIRADARARIAQLTPRERDILTLLAQGLSNADIGRRLHLVEGTVKGHVSSMLDTLTANNRVQAAITAHQAGLVE